MRYQHCPKTGKNSFNSQLEAEMDIIRIYREYFHMTPGKKKIPTGTYLCDHCALWHMTSQYDNRSLKCKAACDYVLSKRSKSARRTLKKFEKKK